MKADPDELLPEADYGKLPFDLFMLVLPYPSAPISHAWASPATGEMEQRIARQRRYAEALPLRLLGSARQHCAQGSASRLPLPIPRPLTIPAAL